MPKENINSRKGDGSDELDFQHRVSVHWSNFTDGWVQVATTRADKVPSSTEAPEHFTLPQGHWVQMDRDGINRLIRQLRRARDHAFGADA